MPASPARRNVAAGGIRRPPDDGPGVQQPLARLVPADQSRLAVPLHLEPRRRVPRALDREDLHRAADPLQRPLTQRVEVEVGVHQLPGDVADHDHARLGGGLDARGEVGDQPDDRVPLHHRVVVAEVGDDDPAGVDAHPHLGRHAEAPVQLGMGVPHRDSEIEAGEHRPPCVVLVGLRVAESGEDPVAQVLHHRAAVPGHGLPRGRPVEGEQVPQLLRLHPLGQHRGPHEVGEEHGHEGALARRPDRTAGHVTEDAGGALVVRIDRAHLLGRDPGRLQVAGRQATSRRP